MVDIQPHTTLDQHIQDGKPWINAVDRAFNKSITLDLTAFTDEDLFDASGRYILSGIPLVAQAGDTGLYVPAVDNTVPDPDVPSDWEGLLFSVVEKVTGATRTSAALMTHGAISVANLPIALPTGDGPALIRLDA